MTKKKAKRTPKKKAAKPESQHAPLKPTKAWAVVDNSTGQIVVWGAETKLGTFKSRCRRGLYDGC